MQGCSQVAGARISQEGQPRQRGEVCCANSATEARESLAEMKAVSMGCDHRSLLVALGDPLRTSVRGAQSLAAFWMKWQ